MAPRVLKHLAVALFVCLAAATVRSQAPNAPTRQAVIDELVIANHILANEGVLDGYGHVSVRNPANPNRYFLARAGAPAVVTAADIVEYDLDSNATTSASAMGYQERFIHGEIYKARPDVTAAIHCHCLEVIPFADTSVPLRPMYHMGYFIGEGVPVFEIRKTAGLTDMLVRDAKLGKALAQSLGQKSAALMRGHGAVVVGGSIPTVVGRSVYLDVNARAQAQAIALGGKITYVEADEAKLRMSDTGEYARAWDLWKRKVASLK